MLISSMLHSTSTEFVLQLYHLHNRITPQKILQFKNLTIFILQLLILILNVISVKTVIATISWPSIIWHLLSNDNVQQIYGINIWQLLSLKFRKWQLHLVEEFIPFLTDEDNIITYHNPNGPHAIFCNNLRIQNFVTRAKSQNFGDIVEAFNKHLIHIILCN